MLDKVIAPLRGMLTTRPYRARGTTMRSPTALSSIGGFRTPAAGVRGIVCERPGSEDLHNSERELTMGLDVISDFSDDRYVTTGGGASEGRVLKVINPNKQLDNEIDLSQRDLLDVHRFVAGVIQMMAWASRESVHLARPAQQTKRS